MTPKKKSSETDEEKPKKRLMNLKKDDDDGMLKKEEGPKELTAEAIQASNSDLILAMDEKKKTQRAIRKASFNENEEKKKHARTLENRWKKGKRGDEGEDASNKNITLQQTEGNNSIDPNYTNPSNKEFNNQEYKMEMVKGGGFTRKMTNTDNNDNNTNTKNNSNDNNKNKLQQSNVKTGRLSRGPRSQKSIQSPEEKMQAINMNMVVCDDNQNKNRQNMMQSGNGNKNETVHDHSDLLKQLMVSSETNMQSKKQTSNTGGNGKQNLEGLQALGGMNAMKNDMFDKMMVDQGKVAPTNAIIMDKGVFGDINKNIVSLESIEKSNNDK